MPGRGYRRNNDFLLPKRLIAALGLEPLLMRRTPAAWGEISLCPCTAVRLTIQGAIVPSTSARSTMSTPS